jgi:hypothetical protein
MNRINTKIGMSMRACNLSRRMNDIIWYYEDTKRFYDWAAIRYAIRYKGASDNLWMVKRWLDDHRQEYEDAKKNLYKKIEERNMKRYSAGFVRPLFNVFEEQGAKK